MLGLLTPFYGPTIRVCVSPSLHQNFFSTTSKPLGTKPLGTRYGPPLALKRSKSSSGRLCVTDSPPKHTYHLDVRLWILAALDASHQKLLYTFFVTILRRKRSGTNPQVSYPYPFSNCHYKNGCELMLRWVGHPYPTNRHGKSVSLSLVGSFGWHEMKEYSRNSPAPNIALSILRYRRR